MQHSEKGKTNEHRNTQTTVSRSIPASMGAGSQGRKRAHTEREVQRLHSADLGTAARATSFLGHNRRTSLPYGCGLSTHPRHLDGLGEQNRSWGILRGPLSDFQRNGQE